MDNVGWLSCTTSESCCKCCQKSVQGEVDDLKMKLEVEVKRFTQEKKERLEQVKLLKNKIKLLEDEEKKFVVIV